MKTALISFILLVVAVLQSAPAQQVTYVKNAAQGNWQIIGTTEARFTADHDVIQVSGLYDNFRMVKFRVTGAPLHMVKIVVTYGNGAPDNIETLFLIPEGAESRPIDLRGVGERKIRRIDFWYDTSGIKKGHAHVIMFGMR